MKALAIATLLCAATAGFAADYEPTEGWPYLFDDFEPATVYYRNSAPAHANINIHLFNNTLHFIDGEDIKAASNALYIDSVVCDNNTVLEHKGKYYVERLYATPHVLVGRTCEADFSSMNKGSGAYGMGTSVSATQNVAAFDDYGNVAARKYNETKADRYNSSTLRFYKNDVEIPLTGRENAMMKLFLDNVNQVFSNDMLYEMIWGEAIVDENAIMVYIRRLRRKIEDDPANPKYIQNIRGLGYRFVV